MTNLDTEPKGLHSWIKNLATGLLTPFGEKYVPVLPKIGQRSSRYKIPSQSVPAHMLSVTPRHLNNQDGRPLIWTYLGSDDPMRGDSHGTIGLGRSLTQRLDGRLIHVDQSMLNENFPHTKNLAEQLTRLCEKSGHPDIMLGTQVANDLFGTNFTEATAPTLIVSDINESLGDNIQPGRDIVPHHLTPDMIKAAGQEFHDRYAHLPQPVIAVFLGSILFQEKAIKKLADIASTYPQCTLFLCPSRNTDDTHYSHMLKQLHKHLSANNATERVHIESPAYISFKTGYNPYQGLIDRADHAVLLGHSLSMRSEIISQGRSLYVAGEGYPRSLEHYLRSFDKQSPGKPLKTTFGNAINITDNIAAAIAREFDRFSRLRTLGATSMKP